MQPVLEIFPVPKRYPYEKITFTIPMHNACLQLYGSCTKIKINRAYSCKSHHTNKPPDRQAIFCLKCHKMCIAIPASIISSRNDIATQLSQMLKRSLAWYKHAKSLNSKHMPVFCPYCFKISHINFYLPDHEVRSKRSLGTPFAT